MNEFDNLKDIWSKQQTPVVPDVSLIIAKAEKERSLMVRKIIIQVITLFLSVVAVAWVVATIDFEMATTYIGAGLMMLIVCGYSVVRIHQVVRINQINLTDDPANVLAQTEQFFKFQQLVNTRMTIAYFILLNLGFGLYFIEVMQPMKTLWIVIFLVVYIAWMLVAYFVIGKRTAKKEHERTESILNSLRKIEKAYAATE